MNDAERHFKEVLRHRPNDGATLELLSFVLARLERYAEAEPYIKLAIELNPQSSATLYNYGLILKCLKRPTEALERFSQALSINATVAETWNNRGAVFNELKRYDEAIADLDKAIALQPNYSEAFANRGNSLLALKRYAEASVAFDKALALNPGLPEAWFGRGNVCNELKRHAEASTAFDRALALKPDLAEAWLGRGNACKELKRFVEASAAFDRAIALKPGLAEAWLGRGNVSFELKQFDDASAAYEKALILEPDLAEAWGASGNVFVELKRYDEALTAFDKAIALKSDLAEAWLGRSNVFFELKRYDDALFADDKALALKPDLAEAWLGRGNVFFSLRRLDDTLSAYDKALALKPALAEAWFGRGNVFYQLGRPEDSVVAYEKAIGLKPDFAEAWNNQGNVLGLLKRYDEAIDAYDNALAIKNDTVGAEGSRLHAKMHISKWENYDAECSHLLASVRNGKANTGPFELLSIPSSSDEQLECARNWISNKFPPSSNPVWQGRRYNHDRIRIAYLSADLRQHAVSTVIAGMFECHDKSRFDVTALSCGDDDNSEMRQRLKASFEHFIDVKSFSDSQISELINDGEIDILVDLMGFTAESRTSIFSRRAAPIQVNYLGYLGTMGASYIDYIIADQVAIPKTKSDSYTEKIVYLPNSFLPADRQRRVSDKKFTRADVGLPPEGFVFCCFNANYKITPVVYDIWMRILKQVDGSVLWLFAGSPIIEDNLRSEAAARGVDGERLRFAPFMPLPEHQARLRLADLFLDTSPYNAGATASDALWAGVPVLTRIGDTFVGRMGASVLNAIGLPELITTTPEAYEQMAIYLASHPEKMTALKRKLADNRFTTPFFDTRLFTRHIETAYVAMYERHQAGLSPDHIVVAH